MAEEYNKQLTELKNRLHISHKSEDASLSSILDTSLLAVSRLVGFADTEDAEFNDLVLNRARYEYYDEGEYFEDNYHATIVRLSFLKGDLADETTIQEAES